MIGVLIITVILLLFFKRPIEKQTYTNLLLVGLLLVLVVLMRRWYAYWVGCFFLTLLFDGFIFRYPSYRFDIKKYVPALRNSLLIGIVSVFLIFLIAGPVAKRMILTDYADIHSAYRDYDSLIVPLQRIYNYFGFIPVLLFLFGALFSMLNRETRRLSLFLFLQFVFIFLLFSRTQNFGPQHFYLLIPTIVVFMSLVVVRILHSRPVLYKISFLVLIVFIYFINFSCALFPKTYAYFERITFPFSDVRHFPLVRGDLGAINDLLLALDL